jgi:hypothetical protein
MVRRVYAGYISNAMRIKYLPPRMAHCARLCRAASPHAIVRHRRSPVTIPAKLQECTHSPPTRFRQSLYPPYSNTPTGVTLVSPVVDQPPANLHSRAIDPFVPTCYKCPFCVRTPGEFRFLRTATRKLRRGQAPTLLYLGLQWKRVRNSGDGSLVYCTGRARTGDASLEGFA